MFVSPAALWKGYDPTSLHLSANIVKETAQNGYTVREVYFNGGETADGSVRGYGRFVYASTEPRPVVLILSGIESTADAGDYAFYLKEGYHLFLLDYAGDRGTNTGETSTGSQNGRFTLYPESRAFSNYRQLIPEWHCTAPDGPRNTCWYDWAVLSMRAVTLLVSFFEVKSSAIFVHGEKEGGRLAWVLAAVDERLAGVIALFEAGWSCASMVGEDKDGSRAAYIAAFSPQVYAQGVRCPILFLGASNEKGASFEKVNDTFMRIPAGVPAYISAAPRLSGQLTPKNLRTALLFLSQCVTGEELLPRRPAIEAKASENKLYYNVTADRPDDIKKIKIYCASNEPNPAIRNWSLLPAESVGGGEYIAKADMYNSDTSVYAFANIEYRNGALLSTATLVRLPAALGIESKAVTRCRLFYDKTMGVDSFFAMTGGLINAGVTIQDGPLGLSGVTAKAGALATYKANDIRYKGTDTSGIQLTVYTKNPLTLTLVAESRSLEESTAERIVVQGKRYTVSRSLSGAEFWQKITIPPEEFKSDAGGALTDWNNIVMLIIDGAGLLVNSVLWV